MKILGVGLVLAFLLVLGGAWAERLSRNEAEDGLLRLIANDTDGTWWWSEVPADVLMLPRPIAMGAKLSSIHQSTCPVIGTRTYYTGPLEITDGDGHAVDVLASVVRRYDGTASKLFLFGTHQTADTIDAVDLEGCQVSRSNHNTFTVGTSKWALDFTANSPGERHNWEGVFNDACSYHEPRALPFAPPENLLGDLELQFSRTLQAKHAEHGFENWEPRSTRRRRAKERAEQEKRDQEHWSADLRTDSMWLI